jgi:hypothetical protein
MWAARLAMMAFGDDSIINNQHRANNRIGARLPQRSARFLQRGAHKALIASC